MDNGKIKYFGFQELWISRTLNVKYQSPKKKNIRIKGAIGCQVGGWARETKVCGF